ncbi:MAG: hypothetical protein HY854_13180 [Burkholderiales bacterium]|nr:hypothetical protein [Burkholderiales bacterium]
MPTKKYPDRDLLVPDYSACMSACETCVVACTSSLAGMRFGDEPVCEAQACVQACEQALHAMSSGALVASAACSACARCCESLALHCMLLGRPEFARCAQACYRTAHECGKVAALDAGPHGRPRPAPVKSRRLAPPPCDRQEALLG